MMNRRMMLGTSLAASALLIAGCAATRQSIVPGSFAWFDLITSDPDAAKSFYGGMFGWQFGSPASDGYIPVSGGGEALGGVIASADAGSDVEFPSQWVPVLTVVDTIAVTKIALGRGGKQVRSPFATSAGTFSTIRDSSGALLVLYDGPGGFPLNGSLRENTWYWADLLTDNPSRARSFYHALAGWETAQKNGQTVFSSGGAVRGGLVRISRRKAEPTWLPYVGVSDIGRAIARSQELGGGPLTVAEDAAVLLDPTGAAVGVSLIGGAA